MNLSGFVTNVIQGGQNLTEHDYFYDKASLSFQESGEGWLDLVLLVWLRSADLSASVERLPSSQIESSLARDAAQLEINKVASTRIHDSKDLREAVQSANNNAKFFFIRQRNSRSRLSISQELFDALCKQCDIFHRVREYVLCFGVRSSDTHVDPPAPRYSIRLSSSISNTSPKFSRFECAYVLRFVEPNNRADGIPWSIRQSGVYHQLQGIHAPPIWCFTALSASLEAQLNHFLSNRLDDATTNPFEIHFVLFDAAIATWRGCILFFAGIIQKQSDSVFMAQFDADEFAIPRLEERQYLKKIEDNILDITAALSFMLQNLDTIMAMYQHVSEHCPPADGRSNVEVELSARKDSDLLQQGFLQRRRDLRLYLDQADVLHRKVQSVSNLVSNILDLNNGNALRLLAIETRQENANMTVLTQKSVEDAATVKILTIVTLVYLPLTVVTNFFSTSFVGTAAKEDGGLRISVTSDVWILFAVGVPLTIITVYIWWIFAQKETRGTFPRVWRITAAKAKAFLTRPTKVEA